MTNDALIRREEIFISIMNEWLRTEDKPIRIETFRLWRAIAKRRLRNYRRGGE